MVVTGLTRWALSICAAAAMLAGCGASQAPIGVPGVMPQDVATTPARSMEHRVPSGSYRVLHLFGDLGGGHHHGYNGVNPYGNLMDVNGTLYGTTQFGGGGCEGGCGTVYSMSTTGAYTVLSRLVKGSGGGANPIAGLIDMNGTFYGTTFDNGSGTGGAGGSVYSVSSTGVVKTLHDFGGGTDGANPWAGLVALNGTLYGTTTDGGGTSRCDFPYGCGTVYSINTSGAYTLLYSFNSGGGALPFGGLVDVNGKLYGTTEYGGSTSCYTYGCGVVFSISSSGEEKVLHSFTSGDGEYPYAGLIDVKGVLYGTTFGGGTYGEGTVYSITTTGTEKVLHSFAGGSDGAHPYAGLIDVKGTLYGTTSEGGGTGCSSGSGCGTVYRISPAGSEAVLHSFGGSPDGARPYGGLIDVSGTLYGTTVGGGHPKCTVYNASGCGTVFALTP